MPDPIQPGEPINIEDVNPPQVPAEPMFPLLANLIPWPKVRLAAYSLWSLWSIIFLAVVVPQVGIEEIAADYSWVLIVNGIGTILFPSVAAANVPRATAPAR